ncbi:hypothetical protein AAF712_004292 [Marasmius tenuissimus]|uniref:N-acetyltransferase domain-containing protein n=1 Tax=Marasmius tenuissimus TaxID=585030 RepID=A0ABR3A7R1_9AGAR|nr:hypothetical protein PM082_003345 [Marasmius tenuissimus]
MSQVCHYLHAEDFLSAAHAYLKDEEASANIVLAHAWSLRDSQRHDPVERVSQQDLIVPESTSHWISVSMPCVLEGRRGFSVKLVLSCVKGELGNYPIFLWVAPGASETEMASVVESATGKLASLVHPKRVFSVFGALAVVNTFARAWTMLTGYHTVQDPYYHALLGKCTTRSLSKTQDSLPVGDTIRVAGGADIDVAAVMCKEFSRTSHFPLSVEKAGAEARLLISRGQLFVYESKGTIAAVCAITRATEHVAAVTMVYTLPRFRNKGSAERLVHHATNETLRDGKKSTVVLYVGVLNSARKIYDRIGFMGLDARPGAVVEEVLELGFMGTEKGHW